MRNLFGRKTNIAVIGLLILAPMKSFGACGDIVKYPTCCRVWPHKDLPKEHRGKWSDDERGRHIQLFNLLGGEHWRESHHMYEWFNPFGTKLVRKLENWNEGKRPRNNRICIAVEGGTPKGSKARVWAGVEVTNKLCRQLGGEPSKQKDCIGVGYSKLVWSRNGNGRIWFPKSTSEDK